MNPRVFVSYRRADSPHVTGRLVDRLIDAFGDDNVFFDVDSIEFGQDFRTVIRDTVRASDTVLAVIGPGFDPDRLSSEADFVRMELIEALAQDKQVVPVLVGDTPMPTPDQLPAELRARVPAAGGVVHPPWPPEPAHVGGRVGFHESRGAGGGRRSDWRSVHLRRQGPWGAPSTAYTQSRDLPARASS